MRKLRTLVFLILIVLIGVALAICAINLNHIGFALVFSVYLIYVVELYRGGIKSKV